jgi:translocation and assembly module TamB
MTEKQNPNPAPDLKAKRKRRWPRRIVKTLLSAAILLVLAVAALVIALAIGWFDAPMRNSVIGQIERVTGGRVELTHFHFAPFSLRVELQGLTVHGMEPDGTPPLFHTDYLVASIQVDSFWNKKVSLKDLRVLKPEVHVRFNADGTSNIPPPRTPQAVNKPFRARLFEFAIRHLELDEGTLLYNDVRAPLVAEGNDFNFAMDWVFAKGAPIYLGHLSWKQFTFAARRYLPTKADLSMKFTFAAESFHVEQMQLKLPHSNVDAQIDVEPLAAPIVAFRYRGSLDLADIHDILRKPNVPGGRVEYSGEGRVAKGEWTADGHYTAHDLSLPYEWFHDSGISSRGTYQIAKGQLVVPDFEAQAFGGSLHGRVNLVFQGLQFQVESHATGFSLAGVLAAVANPSFPVRTFHWDGAMRVDDFTTWTEDFKHLESRGVTDWTVPDANAPKQIAAGKIPVSAHFDYDYSMDRRDVRLGASEIVTPTSRVTISGTLGADNSALDVNLDAKDLRPWNDFINTLRGAHAEPVPITGRATWAGKLTGELGGPTFAGHVHAFDAAYGALYWDEVEGDLTYSPDGFQLARAHARRGNSSAQFDVALTFDEWHFDDDGEWHFDADVVRTPTEGVQQMFGWSYPVKGLLSGQFHGRGTRTNPQITGLFDLSELNAWGWPIDRARGQLTLDHNEVRVANGEVRLTAPDATQGRAPSIVTGNIAFRFSDANVNFDLTGAVIPIENIRRIQTAKLPLGGSLSFQLHGNGPLRAPITQGTVRLVDFRAGSDVLGSFDGKLDADGKRLRVDLNSALPTDRVRGYVELAFSGDLPVFGELDLKDMDLAPLIRAGLHLEAVTGHTSMDGHLRLTGALLKADSVSVDADLSHLAMDYDFVKLENNGAVKFTYKKNEIRIEQAAFKGADTDFQVSGFARFADDRALGMKVLGAIDLRLLGGFVQNLNAHGAAKINVSIEGTISAPRINGRMDVANASANYDDFPAGLSKITGAFVFDASRMRFENLRTEIGGGAMLITGSVSYGEGFNALRYDMSGRAANVRIRYPAGLSWMASGTLHFVGGTQSALLSGNVTVQRLLMAEGFDIGSLVVSSKSPVAAPVTSVSFLRNLQFDIQATTSPDARVEWSNTSFEGEANLRVRGTWENPILLGRISLTNGELSFAGNRYHLSRGDINFSNPFRLDPELNVQATTTVEQYEVTLDISGPASRLALNYRSDPPLPSSDIISLLALGQATESTAYRGASSQQTPQSGATSLLSEAISNQLGGRLEKLFGITRFRVDPFLAGTTNSQNGAPRVTVEERVGHHLTVTYVTNVAGAQEEVIQVEYQVRPDLSIVALRDYNGTFSLDIVRKQRFK